MSCLIRSEGYIPVNDTDIIKQIPNKRDIEIYNDQILSRHIEQQNIPREDRIGSGIFIKVKEEIYCITCLHIISKYYRNIFATTKKNVIIPMSLSVKIPEFDIALLKHEISLEEDIKYYAQRDLEQINDYYFNNDNCYIDGLIFNNTIGHAKIPVTESFISHKYIKSAIIPKFPLVLFKLKTDDIEDTDEQFEGLSGSIFYTSDKKPFAMTLYYENGYLHAIPLTILYSIVTQYIKNNTKLYNFKIDGEFIELSDDSNKDEQVIGYLITKTTLKYKNFISQKLFNFNSNDIIISVNNNSIRCSKEKEKISYVIYSNELNTYLNFDTYLFLMANLSISTIYSYLQADAKFIFESKKINLQRNTINDIFCVNINNSSYVYFMGYIFAELSEELIINLKRSHKLCKYFNNYKNIISTKKIIVLVEIDYGRLSDDAKEQSLKAGLPYYTDDDKDDKNVISLLVLEKVKNNIITDTNDLLKVLADLTKKHDSITLLFSKNLNEKNDKYSISIKIHK